MPHIEHEASHEDLNFLPLAAVHKDLPYRNKNHDYLVGFASKSDTDPLMRFKYKQAIVNFSLPDDAKSSKSVVKDNQIHYSKVYPDTDLMYSVDYRGVKEEWILHAYPEKNKLTMRMKTNHVQPIIKDDGSVVFQNKEGQTIFTIPRPYMIDANLRYSDNLTFNIREDGKNTYLDLHLDSDWLKDKKRKYPVRIDPSITIQGTNDAYDAFVGDAEPSTNYGWATYLTVGDNPDHGTSRSFIKFDLSALEEMQDINISSATMSLWQTNSSTSTETERIYPVTSDWDSKKVTWKNQPNVGDMVARGNVTDSGWYDFNVTALVQDWYAGKRTNYGLSIRHENEQNNRKSYYSSDYAGDNGTKKPKLVVEYTVEGLNYHGEIDANRTHRYQIQTTGTGTLDINQEHSSEHFDYSFYDKSNPDQTYVSGDEVPKGTYIFSVSTANSDETHYSYHLSGLPGLEQNDQHLPTLIITDPEQHAPRITKGTTSISFKGTTDANQAQLTQGDRSTIPVSGDFSNVFSLSIGLNPISAYAESNSNNQVVDSYNPISPGVKRLGGNTPEAMSVNVSQELTQSSNQKVQTVYLTSNRAWVHGLSAVPLASLEKAPFLLTDPETLSSVTKAEIERLNPDKVVIIGGTGSVSSTIEKEELPAMGIQNIERIAGTTRYDTPPMIGDRIYSKLSPDKVPSVFIASGENFEDSLSVVSAAANLNFPILLVKHDSIPESTKNFLQKHEIGTIYIVGKENAISNSVVEDLKNYGPVEDKRGTTRYQAVTNVLYDLKLKPSSVTIAHGWTFQGMLASGTLTSLTNSVTLVTNSRYLSDEMKYYLLNIQDELDYAYIIGGDDTLSSDIDDEVDSYIKP